MFRFSWFALLVLRSLTLVFEPWLDLAFLALGDSTAIADKDGDRPTAPPAGPPRRWPPPEKGMNGAKGAEDEEEDGWELSPDGPASSPSCSETLLSTGGTFGRTASWGFRTSFCFTGTSCLTGSELATEAGVGTGRFSIGLSGLEFWTCSSVVDVAGCDEAGSGCDDVLWVVSLATGVVGKAAVSMASLSSSSPGDLSFLSKNLKKKNISVNSQSVRL